MILIALWLACGIAAAAVASGKGRSGGGWLVLGLLFGPLALLLIAVASRDTAAADRGRLRSGELRRCPACAETIQAEARKCRFCGADVVPERFDVWGRRLD